MHVNEAAAQLCSSVPALLFRRDDLFTLAREVVKKSGYPYSKGHSRSQSSLDDSFNNQNSNSNASMASNGNTDSASSCATGRDETEVGDGKSQGQSPSGGRPLILNGPESVGQSEEEHEEDDGGMGDDEEETDRKREMMAKTNNLSASAAKRMRKSAAGDEQKRALPVKSHTENANNELVIVRQER